MAKARLEEITEYLASLKPEDFEVPDLTAISDEERSRIVQDRQRSEAGGEATSIMPSGITVTSRDGRAAMPIGDDLYRNPGEDWGDFFERGENVLAARHD